MDKFRQFFFQLQVHLQGPVEKTGAGAAAAQLLKGPDAGLHHRRLGGQAQIVVGAQHDAPLALHDHLAVLTGFQGVEIRVDALFLGVVHAGALSAFFKKIDHDGLPPGSSKLRTIFFEILYAPPIDLSTGNGKTSFFIHENQKFKLFTGVNPSRPSAEREGGKTGLNFCPKLRKFNCAE